MRVNGDMGIIVVKKSLADAKAMAGKKGEKAKMRMVGLVEGWE